MKFTGEQCILGSMPGRMRIAQEHIARYNFALGILEQFNCKKVLDAACGTGYGTWLMSNNGFDVSGVDVNLDAVAKALSINHGNKADFEIGSLDTPSSIEFLKDKGFDAIVSFETIEHLYLPDAFLGWASLNSPLLIFSIPINQPSDFHRTVYTVQQAKEQITKHFPSATFLAQVYMNFYQMPEDTSGVEYLVGYATR